MLKNLLGFRDVTLDDVMVPLAEIDGLEIDIDPPVLLPRFAECGHSRMPVYRETLDQPLGSCTSRTCCRFWSAKTGSLSSIC